jgi:hypothetical protein
MTSKPNSSASTTASAGSSSDGATTVAPADETHAAESAVPSTTTRADASPAACSAGGIRAPADSTCSGSMANPSRR